MNVSGVQRFMVFPYAAVLAPTIHSMLCRYFVVADVFMMMQYIYYGALQRRKEKILQLQVHRRHHHRRHHQHGSGRSQQPSPGAYHQVPSHVSSTKNHGVYQRQLLNQQQSMRQPQPHAGQAYHMVRAADEGMIAMADG